MVKIKFYDPEKIFEDDSNPEGMAGEANVKLAASFFHSRNPGKCHPCNSSHARYKKFGRNAGAVLLYKEDSVSLHPASEHKEYHCVSYRQREFQLQTTKENCERSGYGHSERILMRDILDDLIRAEDPGNKGLIPSNNYKSPNSKDQEYEILKYLLDHARIYKEYLERKQIIVKMWSERPACTEEGNMQTNTGGGNCTSFMESICPERSQYGYIVENYKQGDEEEVKEAFYKFASAYKAHMKDSKVSSESCSA